MTKSHSGLEITIMSEVESINWPLVELGRVVIFRSGKFANKLATVVEIIDHNRVLVDGPKTGVPRQGASLKSLTLTNIVIPKVPRGVASKYVAKKWEAAKVDSQWGETKEAKLIARRKLRANLTDFERFQVRQLTKQRAQAIQEIVAKQK